MEELPEDIHDYILSYLSNLEDLWIIPKISKQFQAIAKRYHHPLCVTNIQWTEKKWIAVMLSICGVYSYINEIYFKRCNITETALSGLLMRGMNIINLRECRQINNHSNWMQHLSPLKCKQLALAKCSKLPDFTHVLHTETFHHLQCLLLDRQTFKSTNTIFSKHVPKLRTLAITNSVLYTIPLIFVTELKHLKHLFLGGSTFFNPSLKHLLFNVKSIFNVMEIVETQLKYMKQQSDITPLIQKTDEEYITNTINILRISNHNPLSIETKMQILIQSLSSIFLIIHQLFINGLKCLELSFTQPQNISLAQLYKHREETHVEMHFDGLSIVRLIFLHLLRKYYGSQIMILDFEDYPSKYGGLMRLCTRYSDIRLAIEYVVDLATNECGQTALHIACSDGVTPYVTELLWCRVDCDSRDRRGATPLFQASVSNHYEIVNLLIKNGADIFKRKTTKETPMEIACMRSNVETIKIMLKSASIDHFNDNSKYDNQWSPIHCCCLSGNTHTLKLLIDNGLNYAAQNFWKESPLHICAVKNYVECASILVQRYSLEELMIRDEFNKTAERIAKENNNYDVVQIIQHRKQELYNNKYSTANNRNEYYGDREQRRYGNRYENEYRYDDASRGARYRQTNYNRYGNDNQRNYNHYNNANRHQNYNGNENNYTSRRERRRRGRSSKQGYYYRVKPK